MSGWVSLAFDNPIGTNQSLITLVKCDEIEVKMEITHTTGNLPNGEILLEFKNSSESYACFIFSGSDGKNRLDVKGNKFSDLGKGDYNLYIQNKDGCTKHVKFKIN
jgi:hypothetical protein